MIEPAEYADIMLTLAHPWGDVDLPLVEWAARGPRGGRPLVSVIAAKRISTGVEVPLEEIPEEYLNTPATRRKQREGLLPTPWGPPPDEPPRPSLDNLPAELREEYLRIRYGEEDGGR